MGYGLFFEADADNGVVEVDVQSVEIVEDAKSWFLPSPPKSSKRMKMSADQPCNAQ